MAKSPEEARASMIQNLKQNTGKSLPEWLAVVGKTKLVKHGEIVKHLKAEFGIGHGFANCIALESLKPAGAPEPSGDDLVDAQYAGAKSGLKPIYAAIVKLATKLGKDVVISPKKTYVSLRRNKQFALIQPTTATRIDVGINLKGIPTTDRLEASGSFNAMVSHRVRVSNAKEVDAELEAWLKKAYDAC
jgi:hypothetical protein